ncbi:MAG: ABC transporter permease, partial [Candidatus Hodarchaeota archaeon]
MFRNIIKITLRNLKRQKVYSFINILGLAIGMTSAILILLWIQDELSYDKFHEQKNELYLVFMRDADDPNSRGSATVPFSLAPILKQEFPEVVEFTRMQLRSFYESCMLKHGNKVFYEDGILLVDPSFFNMFTYRFIKGNRETALMNKNSMVITQDIATKYFGEEEPLGKILKFNNRLDFVVSGVIENIPHNSELQFDFIASIQNLGDSKLNSWSWESFSCILLQKNTSIPDLKKKIAGSIEKHHPIPGLNLVVDIQSLTRVHLHHGSGDIRLVYIFMSVAIFILVIACINYMNLTTARFNKRAKEVGLRKVVGAHRGVLIRQFFGESISLSLVALFIAFIFVEILLSFFNNLTDKNLVFISSSNYLLLFSLIGLAIIVGMMAGSYPAFFLSSFQPAVVLRGLLKSSTKSPLLRMILVVTQFTIAIILIICTIIVYRQHNYMIHKKLGYNKDQIIYIPINQEFKQKYDSLKNKLLQNPDIKNVTVASSLPNRIGNTNPIEWEGKTSDEFVLTKFAVVDHDYLDIFQMKLLEGRNFSKEFTADISNFIINKKAAELMSLENPINKQVTFMNVSGKIIGII